jgi:hypothetical protein
VELKTLFNLVELLIFTAATALSIAVWVESHEPEWIFISMGVIAGFLRFVVTLLSEIGILPLRLVSPAQSALIESVLSLLPLLLFITAFILYLVRKSKH